MKPFLSSERSRGEAGRLFQASLWVLSGAAATSLLAVLRLAELPAALSLSAGGTVDAVGNLHFPYPTMVEGLKLCASSFRKEIGMLSCCAGCMRKQK